VRYEIRTELDHLPSAEVWMVIHTEPTDDYLSDGMVPLPDDYVIRCIADPRGRDLGIGALRRVHRDYLHGSSWSLRS
jgi:hypothetical protein